MSKRRKRKWAPPTGWRCECGMMDDITPGSSASRATCDVCGTKVRQWMTDEEFAEYVADDPLEDD